MDIFSAIGTQEILMILLVAMLVIGPNKIAEFGKTLGNITRNIKKASTDFTSNLNREIEAEDKNKKSSIPQNVKSEKKA